MTKYSCTPSHDIKLYKGTLFDTMYSNVSQNHIAKDKISQNELTISLKILNAGTYIKNKHTRPPQLPTHTIHLTTKFTLVTAKILPNEFITII